MAIPKAIERKNADHKPLHRATIVEGGALSIGAETVQVLMNHGTGMATLVFFRQRPQADMASDGTYRLNKIDHEAFLEVKIPMNAFWMLSMFSVSVFETIRADLAAASNKTFWGPAGVILSNATIPPNAPENFPKKGPAENLGMA